MKNVIILGKTSVAIGVAKYFIDSKEYQLIGCVPSYASYEDESFSDFLDKNQIEIIDIDSIIKIKCIFLIVSVFYDKVISSRILDKANMAINIHLSALPKYRGTRSINWALKNNENFQGVTIHKMVEKLDAGDIISQVKFTIYPYFQEVSDVYYMALSYALKLFIDTMPIIDSIIPIQQNNDIKSYYSSKQNVLLGDRLTFTKKPH